MMKVLSSLLFSLALLSSMGPFPGVHAQAAWANETCVIPDTQTSSSCGVASGLAAGAEVIIYLKLMRQGALCTTCQAAAASSLTATLGGVSYSSLQCSESTALCFLIFQNVQTAGDSTLAVALSGTAISGSPYTVVLNPADDGLQELSTSVLGGTGLTGGAVNSTISFTLSLQDQFSNALSSTSFICSIFAVSILFQGTTGSPSPIFPSCSFEGGATFSFTYSSTLSGLWQIDLRTTDPSTYSFTTNQDVTLTPLGVSTETSSLQVITIPVAGQDGTLEITARDAFSNQLTSSGVTWLMSVSSFVALDGGNNQSPGLSSAAFAYESNGLYSATFSATRAGQYALSISASGLSGSLSSSVTISPNRFYAPSMNVAGALDNLPAGSLISYTVKGVDQFGNAHSSGSVTLSATVHASASSSSSQVASVTVAPGTDGSSSFSFTVTRSGMYSMFITLTGSGEFTGATASVGSNPTNISVSAKESGLLSSAFFAVASASASAGARETTELQEVDEYGNLRTISQESFTVSMVGPYSSAANVTDIGQGKYTISYVLTISGTYSVRVTTSAATSFTAPNFQVDVSASAPAASASLREDYLTYRGGETVGSVNRTNYFAVKTVDRFGNRVTVGGLAGAFSFQMMYCTDPLTACVGQPSQQSGSLSKVQVVDLGSGYYGMEYLSTVAGYFAASVLYDSTHIFDSPWDINVNAGLTDSAASFAFGLGQATCSDVIIAQSVSAVMLCHPASAATPSTFDVRLIDVFGNERQTYSSQDAVIFSVSSGLVFFNQISEQNSSLAITSNQISQQFDTGLHVITFIATISAFYSASIQHGEVTNCNPTCEASNIRNLEDISNTPAQVFVKPAAPHAPLSYAEGDGLSVGTAGVTSSFVIYTRDAYMNDRFGVVSAEGLDQGWALSLSGPVDVAGTIVGQSDGSFHASFLATVAGEYSLAVRLNNEALSSGLSVSGSPFLVRVYPSPASPASYVTGTSPFGGRVAVTPAAVRLQAVDEFGNERTVGMDDFQAVVPDLPDTQIVQVDNGDGTYDIEFYATKAGMFQSQVSIFGVQLSGSPFDIEMLSGVMVPEKSEVVPSNVGTAGEQIMWTLTARDIFYNEREVGNDDFTLECSNQKDGGPGAFLDYGNGTYEGICLLTRSGSYQVSVQGYNANFSEYRDVISSPFSLEIEPNVADPGSSGVYGSELSLATAGDWATFYIFPRDRFLNPNTGTGGAKFELAMRRLLPDNTTVPVPGCPYQVPSLEWGDLTQPPEGITIGATSNGICASVDTGNGTSTMSYMATVAGTYFFAVTIITAQGAIPTSEGDTLMFLKPSVTDTASSFAFGSALEIGTAGEAMTFLVQSRDRFENVRTSRGGVFNMTVTGLNVAATGSASVIDLEDGTHLATYSATLSAMYSLLVFYDSVTLGNSPANVTLFPGYPDPTQFLASGPGITGGNINQVYWIVAQSKDRFGNIKTQGGSAMEVVLNGGWTEAADGTAVQPAAVPGTSRDLGDGRYNLTYTVTRSGVFQISVRSLDPVSDSYAHVVSSPFLTSFATGGISAVETTAFAVFDAVPLLLANENQNVATAGKDDGFVILAKDAFGNPRTEGGQVDAFYVFMKWEAPLDGIVYTPEGIPNSTCPVVYSGADSGQYRTTYTATVSGIYGVTISFAGEEVTGHRVHVYPSRIDAGTCFSSFPEVDDHGDTRYRYTTAGAPSTFTVLARDLFNNPVLAGGDKFFVNVTATSESDRNGDVSFSGVTQQARSSPTALCASEACIVDNGDGSYTVSITPTVSGLYSVAVFLESEPICQNRCSDPLNSPYTFTTVPTDLFGALSLAYGSGLSGGQAGFVLPFQIQAVDVYGNNRTHGRWNGDDGFGGEFFRSAIRIRGPLLNSALCGCNRGICINCAAIDCGSALADNRCSQLPAPYPIVKDLRDGRYDVSYSLTQAAQYTIAIIANDGLNLKYESPFSAIITPGVTDPAACTTLGDGLYRAVAGEVAVGRVQAQDAYGNYRRSGGDEITIMAQHTEGNRCARAVPDGPCLTCTVHDEECTFLLVEPGATKPLVVRANLTDPDTGQYGLAYIATVAGFYQLRLKINGTSLGTNTPFRSPFPLQVVPNVLDPTASTVDGEGVSLATVFKTSYFNLWPRDRYGNSLATAKDPTYIQLCTSDIKSDCLQRAGFAYVKIAVFNYNNGKVYPVKEKYSRANIDTEVNTGTPIEAEVRPNRDGSTTVFYAMEDLGTYRVSVEVLDDSADADFVPIRGSPYNLSVYPDDPVPFPPKCNVAAGQDTVAGNVGRTVVTLRNQYGITLVDNARKDMIEVAPIVGNPSEVEITVSDRRDGTFDLNYQLTRAGQYYLAVTVVDANGIFGGIQGSPFPMLVVPSETDPKSCIAFVTPDTTATAGIPFSFVIQTRDEFGNDQLIGAEGLEDAYDAVLTRIGSTDDPLFASVTRATPRETRFIARFTDLGVAQITVSGQYELIVNNRGIQVMNSPHVLPVEPAVIDATRSVVDPSGISVTTAGAVSFVRIQARDRFDNSKTDAQGSAFILVKNQTASPAGYFAYSTTYVLDGVTEASFENRIAGSYLIHVLLTGQNILNSPFRTKVIPGRASAQYSYNKTAVPNSGLAGTLFSFAIQAADAFGNGHTAGGEKFDVTLKGDVFLRTYVRGVLCVDIQEANTCISVVDQTNGQYLVTFTPSITGDYFLEARLLTRDGTWKQIGQPGTSTASPWRRCIPCQSNFEGRTCERCRTLIVLPNVVALESSTVTGTGALRFIAGVETSFTFYSRDLYRNLLTTGGLDVSVRIVLSSSTVPLNTTVTDLCALDSTKCGQYTVEYMSTTAGSYAVSISVLGMTRAMPSILGLPSLAADPGASGLPWLPYSPPLCAEFGCSGLRCCLLGEGSSFAITGEETTFLVQARDKFGNDMTSGGAPFDVEITGPTFTVGTVEDMGTGQYVAKYKALVAGEYSLAVRLRGIHIGLFYDSCADPTVQCFESSPSPVLQVTDPGTGLEGLIITGIPSTLEAGVPATVKIDATDRTARRKLSQNALQATFVPVAVGEDRATELTLDYASLNSGQDYDVEVQTTVATQWELWLTSGSFIHLVGSPFAVEVTAAQLSLANTIVTDSSQQSGLTTVNGQLGVELTMYVITRDAFQNSRQYVDTNDVVRFKLWFSGESEPQVETLCQRANGDFRGQYMIPHVPDIIGDHNIRVTVSRAVVDSSLVPKLVVRSVAAPVSQAETVAYGAGLQVGTAGTPLTFTLEARDIHGSTLRSGGVQFAVQLSENSVASVVFPTEQPTGTYLVSHVLTKTGTYRVLVSLDMNWASAKSLGSVQILPAVASAGATQALSGLSWMLGEALVDSITSEQVDSQIQLFDRFGNLISESLPVSDLSVVIEADTRTTPRIEARYCTTPGVQFSSCLSSAWHDFDGTYRVLYAATKAGQYRVSINLQGEPIDGSPWQRMVTPGPADITTSIVAGAGLFGATAGMPAVIAVTARDMFGNPVEADSNINITLSGPSYYSATVSSISSAEFEATYMATRSGLYDLHIQINSVSVPNSPFGLEVAASDTDYRTCVAYGEGLSRVVAGDIATFTIIARDRFGNMRSTGGDLFRITLSGPSISTGIVQEYNNGTYLAQYQLELAGDYVLVVAVGFDQFLYIPRLPCEPAAVSGDATQLLRRIPSEVIAGTQIDFETQARDRFGSMILNCDFTMEIDVTSDFTESGRSISYYGDQTWQCQRGLITGYIPNNVLTQTGQYQVSVLIGSEHVFDSPFTSVVRAATASDGQSFGYGVTETVAGVQRTFWVESRDSFGNMVMSNPFVQAAEFQVMLQLAGFGCNDDATPAEPGAICSLATVSDLMNSTFTASFTLTKSGRYEIIARLQIGTGLLLIRNTPATLWVLPAPLEPTRSIAVGYPRNISAETFTSFLMYSRDKFDNIVVGSLGKFEVFAVRRGEETGNLESIADSATVVYQDEGAYEVAFFLTTAAQYRVVMLADGLQLLNSPFDMDVLPGALVVSESTLDGGGADGGITGFPATFTIFARDSNGNRLWNGGDPWRIRIFTPSDLSQSSQQASINPVHVDNEDGSYFVSYTSTQTGRHLMIVEGFVGTERVTVRGGVRDYVFFVVDDGYSVPGRSIAYGLGTYGGTVGETISLTVQIRNELGLNRPSSGLILSAGLALLGETASTLQQLTPVDNNDGTYTVNYLSRLAGDYELTLKLSGDHILGSPFIVNIIPSETFIDSTTFTLLETSTIVAAAVTFKIQSRDEFWNSQRGDLFGGPDPFKARFIAQNGQGDFEARIYDNEDGSYTGSYSTTVAGAYKLTISLNSQQIGPIVDISVAPGVTMNDNCFVSGSGVSAMVAGQVAEIFVIARDLYGNVVQHGREVFNVTMLNPTGGLVWLGYARHCDSLCINTDNCPCPEVSLGQYALTYSVEKVGEYLVSVRRQNGLLPGSPSTVVVSESFVVTTKTTVVGCEEECLAQISACNSTDGECGCTCSILTPLLSGSQFSLIVQSRDSFNNAVFEGRKAFLVSMYKATPPGRTGCFASEGCTPARLQGVIEDNLDGTYTVVLAPAVPGSYVLEITRSKEHVQGSPFLVEVVPGTASASPDGSRFSLTPVATAGVEKSLTISARDIFGNQLTSGGDQFSLNLAGLTEETGTATVTTLVQDDSDGTYFATFRTETAGLYEVSVLLDGVQIYPGLVEVAVLPAAVVPSRCLVDGTGLESPQPAGDGSINARYLAPELRVVPRDTFGNTYNFDGLDIEVLSQGLDGLAVSVSRTTSDPTYAQYVDCGSGCGEYRFINPLTVAGRYSLGVNLQTRDAAGAVIASSSLLRTSSLSFEVTPGSVYSANCEVSGAGAGTCTSDTICTFTIQAKDAFDNIVEQRGDTFVVVLTHQTETLQRLSFAGVVEDMLEVGSRVEPGQYQASYQATRSGTYTLSISRYGTNVKGSPRVVTVLPGTPHPPSFSIEGYGAIGGVVSSRFSFIVYARDMYGNVVSDPNVRRDLAVTVSPSVAVTIDNLRDGKYGFQFTPLLSTTHNMNLTVFGALLASPLHIDVGSARTAVDFRFTSIDDTTSLSAVVATIKTFTITPRKFGGDQVPNQNSLYEVVIGTFRCPVCSAIPVTEASTAGMVCCINNDVDPPQVTYSSGTAGIFRMEVVLVRGDLLQNPPIYGSPYTVAISPEATIAGSSVLSALPGVSIAQTTAGFPNQLVIQPRDVYNNNQVFLATGAPTVMAALTGPSDVTTDIRDLSDGSFQLLFSMTIAGTYSLDVTIDGAPINRSPFSIEVGGDSLFVPASTANFSTWGTVGEDPDGLELLGSAGQPCIVSVQPRDAYGNALTTDVGTFAMQISRGFPVVTSLTYSQADNHYELTHTLTASGSYRMNLYQVLSPCAGADDCENVFGSPFTLQVQPGKIDVANCRPYGSGTFFAIAGVETEASILVRDAYGNNAVLPHHAQFFSVRLTSRAVEVAGLYQFDLNGNTPVRVDAVGARVTPDGVTLQYKALMPGRYELTADFDGTVIGGTSGSVCGVSKPCPIVDFENPPAPAWTKFSNSGGRILVQFERPTDTANQTGVFDCSLLFSEETVASLSQNPSDSSCVFLNPSMLDISLGFGASIQVNDDLIWKQDVLRLKPVCAAGTTVCFPHSRAIEGTSRVGRPDSPVAPVAIIKAPASVGPCDDVVLDASSSYGSAGRQVSFFFGLQAGSTNDKQVRTAVFGQMREPFDTSIISLPSTILRPGESYTFLVRATNFLDASSVDSVTVRRRMDNGPLVFIEGPNTMAVRASQAFKLRASATLSQCHSGPNDKVVYSWSLVSITPVDSTQVVVLNEQTRGTRSLYVPANSFVPGFSYLFQVTATMEWDATNTGSASVVINCEYAPLIARITGGNRAVWSASSFELDATGSIDLDGDAAVGDFVYEWSCVNNAGAECFADDRQLLSANVGVLFVDRGMLTTGVYHFTVRVVKEPGPRSASTTVTMYIVPGPTDSLQIEPLSQRKVNANERLVLNGMSTNTSCSLMWYQLLGHDVLQYPELVSTKLDLKSIALKPNILLPGATYKFRLATTCPGGLDGFAEINVLVNTAPSSGQFLVQPTRGYAAVDSFSLVLKNWVDDAEDLPFTYEFRYATPAAPAEQIPLGTIDANFLDVHLPAPAARHGDAHNLTVVASVIDNLRGKATSSVIVEVIRLPNSNGTFVGNGRRLQEFSTAMLDQFVATENVEGIIQMTVSLASQEELECLTREVMIANLKDAAAKVVMNAAEVAGFAAALRSAMTGECIGNTTSGVRRLMSMSATASALEVTQTLVGNSISAGLDPTAEQGMGDTLSTSLGNIATKNSARRSLHRLLGHEEDKREFFRGRRRSRRADGAPDDGEVLMETLAGLGASQLTGAVVGEDAKGLSTESISMSVKQDTSAALNGATLGAGAASFSTPSSMLAGDAPLSAQTANLAVSPFSSAENVGEVATLTLGVELSNLEEPVALSVPVNFGVQAGAAMSFVCLKSDDAVDGSTYNSLSACSSLCAGGVCMDLPGPACDGDLWTSCQYEDVDTCRFWNGEDWDGEGCIAQGLVGNVLHCECFHLTDFGGATSSALPKMNFVDPTNPGAVFANLSPGKILVIVIVCVMLLTYFALCYWGWRQDRRDNAALAEAKSGVGKYPVGKPDATADDVVLEGGNYHLLKRAMQGKLTRSILLVKNRAVKLFKNEHKLFGAFWGKRSYYTRPRRFTVLFCMIIGNMFVSALFVGQEGTTFVQKIVAGIFSGLLMLPATIFFKKVFMTLSVDPETKARWDAEAAAKAKAEQAKIATSLTSGPTEAGMAAPPSEYRPDGYRQNLARGHIPHPDKGGFRNGPQGPRPGFFGQFKRKLRVGGNSSDAAAPLMPTPPPLPPNSENGENGGSTNGSINEGDGDTSQLSQMEAAGGYIPRRALPLRGRAHAPAPTVLSSSRSGADSPEYAASVPTYGVPFAGDEETVVVAERQEMMLEHEVHTKKESRVLSQRAKFEASLAKALVSKMVKPTTTASKEAKKVRINWRFQYAAYALAFVWYMLCCYFCILYGVSFSKEIEQAWLIAFFISIIQDLLVQESFLVSAKMSARMIILPNVAAWMAGKIADRYE